MHINKLYEQVTQSIIADLEAGVAPWVKPWKDGNGGGFLPFNAATKRTYNGINIPILWQEQYARGYKRNGWMTYKQAQELGAQVRAGEKASFVVFTKQLTFKEEDSDEEKRARMLRAYSVFNVEQIDGLSVEPELLPPTNDDIWPFIDATKADITIGGDKACYIPSLDRILLPPESAFTNRSHFLATALHELCHWTGAPWRLKRDLRGRFKSQSYAAEELVAELGAAFLCAHLGIKGELRHADYLAIWLKLLKNDNRAIFTAAALASKAADYLRAFSEKVEKPVVALETA